MKAPIALALLFLSALGRAAPAKTDASATVERLYHDYAWEIVLGHPNRYVALLDEPRATLELYFDHALSDLIAKDNECRERTHEVCKLDFLPMWASQGEAATDVKISSTAEASVVRVAFSHWGKTKNVELTYILAKSSAGWRITNVQGDGFDLREILSRK